MRSDAHRLGKQYGNSNSFCHLLISRVNSDADFGVWPFIPINLPTEEYDSVLGADFFKKHAVCPARFSLECGLHRRFGPESKARRHVRG